MNIENNDIVMKHCPYCETVCLILKTDIVSARAENKLVCISCHQCQKQFALDGEQAKDRKIARSANLKIVTCPSCKNHITLPSPVPDQSTVDLFCPLCGKQIDYDEKTAESELSHSKLAKPNLEKADLNPTREAIPGPKSPTNYMPLYILVILCLGAYVFWAFKTGQLPVDALPFDQWFKNLE